MQYSMGARIDLYNYKDRLQRKIEGIKGLEAVQRVPRPRLSNSNVTILGKESDTRGSFYISTTFPNPVFLTEFAAIPNLHLVFTNLAFLSLLKLEPVLSNTIRTLRNMEY